LPEIQDVVGEQRGYVLEQHVAADEGLVGVSAAEAPIDVGALLAATDVGGLEGEGAADGKTAKGPDGVVKGRNEALGGGGEREEGGEERAADGEEVKGVEEGELPGG
jgi:hypothetical protein